MNNKTILITGGTGLVGRHLTQMLTNNGYKIKILTTNKSICNNSTLFYWNIITDEIDSKAFENVDYIIHLAGANIAEKRWTDTQKKLIIDSRTQTTQLLFNYLNNNTHSIKAFISASATGYYGAITINAVFTETDNPDTDFLGNTCQQWEESINKIKTLGIRTVILRTGIVLAKDGGAIAKLIVPAKLGLSAALGSGNQFFPWIHIDDLCNMYIKAIEDESLSGAYNAVAPEHITNHEFTKELAKSLHKPYFMPNVPAFFLKLVLGKMSIMLLTGSKVSSKKIQATGFIFKYASIKNAFNNLVNSKN